MLQQIIAILRCYKYIQFRVTRLDTFTRLHALRKGKQ